MLTITKRENAEARCHGTEESNKGTLRSRVEALCLFRGKKE